MGNQATKSNEDNPKPATNGTKEANPSNKDNKPAKPSDNHGGEPVEKIEGRPYNLPQRKPLTSDVVLSGERREENLKFEGNLEKLAQEFRMSEIDAFEVFTPEVLESVLDHWKVSLRYEHASVASFARFAIDLMTIEAPLEMIERAQKCSLEEIEHAKICALVVGKIMAAKEGENERFAVKLGKFPKHHVEFDGDLARLCKAVAFEGCINESIAAAHLLYASQLCSNESLKALLKYVAEQEWGHAVFAFDCFYWMMEQLPLEDRISIQSKIENELRDVLDNLKKNTKGNERCEAFGVLSGLEEGLVRAQVVHKILMPEFVRRNQSFSAQKRSFKTFTTTLNPEW
jgi:hypothetical protein